MTNWYEANQRYLMYALALVRDAIEHRGENSNDASALRERFENARAAMPAPAALERLGTAFDLSPFERDILLMCAGIELDAEFARVCPAPTFGIALAVLPHAHWSALTPDAPLRHWRMVELTGNGALTTTPLRIDECILHYLVGAPYPDERLAGIVEPLRAPDELLESQRALVARWIAAWQSGTPVIELCGDDVAGKRAVAFAACNGLGLNVCAISAGVIPAAPTEIESLSRLWSREAVLSASALFLDWHEFDASDRARTFAVTRLIENIASPLIVASHERRAISTRAVIVLDVPKPTTQERRALWRAALGANAERLNGHVEALSAQFNLSASVIRSATADASSHLGGELGDALWSVCRVLARPRLDDLAQRIETRTTWDDLVLPNPQRDVLREIAAQVRQRVTVYETWELGALSARGLGISALFAGASGTGKTMAAEVLANELRLDLYRIDLSQVTSKYIGETEKNLRRVFDAAEDGGAILLFDEADALFGKRSEVKDSHDRYANIEVGYLLQRMEAYRGLAILTTNMKNALDPAFLRRIRFVVQFPFPDAAQRAEIWRRIFPRATPIENLDVERLARLNIAGGNIHNIALNAAFLAADAGEPIRMAHLLRAARGEYAKLEKNLTDAEIGGWV